ncbi:MAG: crossover junction endodeoxyribonuclease RuvC [Planctomycetota bacterium]|nr:crossover junction endodeoxyribonuclease RuvC [Planctomycetota bacterium]
MSARPLRVMGIDPGTRRVGFGVIEALGATLRYVECGLIVAQSEDAAKRLVEIHLGLQAAIRRLTPAIAVVETVYAGDNIRTALAIGEGRGVAILSAAELGVDIAGLEPALVKRAVTGTGRASKEQVLRMVRVLLGLPQPPATDHEADALALAIAYANRLRFGLSSGAGRIANIKPRRRRYKKMLTSSSIR